jgi:hypothetical protein
MCGRIALSDDPDHLGRLLKAGVDPGINTPELASTRGVLDL